ncbi:MAG TPA: serine hydrolase [Ferruginibacter sp.]|nr:serine hydrolase [Ferruginibacter sp.]
MKRFTLFLISVVFTCTQVRAQQDSIPLFVRDSIDAYIQKAMTDWEIPGMSVCIVRNNKVVLMKGYGVKELGGNDKVDENTLFMIGSNTKAFTATSLATLDAENKLSLDDNVTKWIPQFKLDNKAAGEQAIIRDLLCHRIGFRTFQGDFTYWTSNLTRKEVIEKMHHIKATYPFRTKWGYTNAAFLTAGEIIPAVTGKQWEDYVKEKIFTPLGMDRTLALSRDLPNASNKAYPYTTDHGKLVKIPFCLIDNLAPAGSISSSVNDMSKWVMMQLNMGKFNDKEIVPQKAIQSIRFPNSIMGNGSTPDNRSCFTLYGLGLELQDYEGRRIVSHTGGVNGFVSSVTMVPAEKLGIVILTNTDQNNLYEALKWDIIDAYLKLPARHYSDLFLGFTKQQRDADQQKEKKKQDSVAMHLKTELPLASYAGDYTNDVYGKLKIAVEDNELRMHFEHHPNMYTKLSSLGGNRFYAVFTDPEFGTAVFPFNVENGKVKGVRVKVADFVEFNAYEFVKK